MTKTYQVIVSKCNDCKNKLHYMGGCGDSLYTCQGVNPERILYKRTPDGFRFGVDHVPAIMDIPDWCPLEEYKP